MSILLEKHLESIASPANLIINDQIKRYRENCLKCGCTRPYHHFAFGQSPFMPPPTVIEALSDNASKHDYLPTAGIKQLRESAAKFYEHNFGLNCGAEQIIISPGSKEMISMLLATLSGSVLIPVPSWVSYLPQAEILKKEIIPVNTSFGNNYKLTPDQLLQGIERSSQEQKILILNHPHNPTGTMYSESELKELAEICMKNNVVIIADEIYALTSFNKESFVSMGKIYPEGTIVTGGLSKDRSAGGYRLGVGVFPQDQQNLMKNALKIAGSTYSCVAAPIQYAALEAYSENEAVEDHIRYCREINAAVGKYVYNLFSKIPGVKTSKPYGGFYLLVDFNGFKEQLFQLGIKTSLTFAEELLKHEHTALLPGKALLLNENDFSFRCSYVDYGGEEALKEWMNNPPETETEKTEFVLKYCPLIVSGIKNIERFIEQIQKGNYPTHFSN